MISFAPTEKQTIYYVIFIENLGIITYDLPRQLCFFVYFWKSDGSLERGSCKSSPVTPKSVQFLNKKKFSSSCPEVLLGTGMASSLDHSRTNSVPPKQDGDIKRKENAAINLALKTKAVFRDCLQKCGLSYTSKSVEYNRVYAEK